MWERGGIDLREEMDFGMVVGYVVTGCDADANDHTDEGEDGGAMRLLAGSLRRRHESSRQADCEDGNDAEFRLRTHLQVPDRLDG